LPNLVIALEELAATKAAREFGMRFTQHPLSRVAFERDCQGSPGHNTNLAKQCLDARQTTVGSPVVLHGEGIHSGASAVVTLRPAEADAGIMFRRYDEDGASTDILASYRALTNATLCTALGSESGTSVATVEHLLAAIHGLHIDNLIIEIDGAEVPIMDGSSAAFIEAIDSAGIRELDEPRRFIRVLKTIQVQDGRSWGELRPHSGFHLDVEISFDTPVIGRQRLALEMSPGIFRAELSRARTFGFMKDVEALRAAGRALGSSLQNTVAIGDGEIINPEGLRYSDEFVRHKMLDAVGDLALAGAPMLCAYRSSCGGHKLNSSMLKALFADEDAWAVIDAPSVRQSRKPTLSYQHCVA
jgi:UDP-3-O-[3-hydroxymyristoyl] N-acetylglucosamine deacetylase